MLRDHAEASFSSAMHARIRASIAGIESRGRKRTRRNLMDHNGTVDRGALLGVLTSWAFDHNTVESTLLFAAAMVCVMGLLFESAALLSGTFGGAQAAVQDVTLAVIILAVLYYLAVLVMEVYVLTTERAREAALLRQRRGSRSKAGGSSKDVLTGSNASSPGASKRNLPVQTGMVDVALNPLFTSASSGDNSAALEAAARSGAAIDAVRAFSSSVPPLELWRVIAASYESLDTRQAALAAELAATKIALEKALGGADGVGDSRAVKRASSNHRANFQPQSAAPSDGVAPPVVARMGSSGSDLKSLAAYASRR